MAEIVVDLPPRGRLMLRGDAGVREAASAILGLSLPSAAYGSAAADGLDAFWLEPDAWLVQIDDPIGAAARLREALGDLHHAVVDVSERLVGLAVAGPHAIEILAAGCPLDLHPRAFPTGHVTRTLVGKAEVILLRRDDRPGFELLVGRSFVPYLRRWLDQAGREHAVGEVA